MFSIGRRHISFPNFPISGEKNHKCPTCGKLFRVRGDLKRHLKIHLRLLEKEQTQKRKDDAELVDSMMTYSEDCNTASDYKIKYNKQTNNDDTLKSSNIMYGDAANGDIIFNVTSNLIEVTATATNNNVENVTLPSPRKRKPKSNLKQKKGKIQESMQSLSVLQLSSSTIGNIQTSETLVTSIPVDINKMLPKQEKDHNITVSVSDEQYQIYLLGA